jgi:hypothetical protein
MKLRLAIFYSVLIVLFFCPFHVTQAQGRITRVLAVPQTGNACGAGLPSTTHCIIVSWGASPVDAAGDNAPVNYLILKASSSGTESSTPYSSVASPTLSYIDLVGTAGKTYYYEIEAQNNAGTSAPSTECNALFLGNAPATPTAPVAVGH